jgi:hypothetical protein
MTNQVQTFKATITNHYVSESIHGGMLHTFTIVIARPDKKNMTSQTVYHTGLINEECYKKLVEFIHCYLGGASKLDDSGKASMKKGKVLELRTRKVFDNDWNVENFLTLFDGAVHVSAANAA